MITHSFLSKALVDLDVADTAYGYREVSDSSSALPVATETVVIGGGLLGLSTALELAQAGRDVVVLEAGKIGGGPSGRSGGQLWPGYEGAISAMVESFGTELALAAWNLTHEALGGVHRRAAERADKCDFRPGVLLASKTTPQAEWIESEAKTFETLGLTFATLVSGDEIRQNYVGTKRYRNGLLYGGHEEGRQYGHLNPLKYTRTVAQLARANGADLICETSVTAIDVQDAADFIVTTPQGKVRSKNIVVATGANFMRPLGLKFAIVPRAHVGVRSVILATEPIPEALAREMVPGDACFCDAADAAMNYGAVRPEPTRPGYYRLTFGGADALAQIQLAFEVPRIERDMRALFPQLDRDGVRIEYVWSCNCDLSRTAIPFLTNPVQGLFYASGFSGQGMVNTTLYGRAIAERILGMKDGAFNILQRLNPRPYANNRLLAWGQAAQPLLRSAYEVYREERAERRKRQ